MSKDIQSDDSRHAYEIHPAAHIFPEMTEDEFREFKRDIDNHGVREPIVLLDGKLIDGRHRLRACNELGIEPMESELTEDVDPIAYVISANLHRRHLNASQRAIVAAKLASLSHGGDRKSQEIKAQNCVSIDDAAKIVNVSPRLVDTARQVIRDGSPEIVQAVEHGELAVSAAVQQLNKQKLRRSKKPEYVPLTREICDKINAKFREQAIITAADAERVDDDDDRGECPRGGDHDWHDDEAGRSCRKCCEPGERQPVTDVSCLLDSLCEISDKGASYTEILPTVFLSLDATKHWLTGKVSGDEKRLRKIATSVLECLFEDARDAIDDAANTQQVRLAIEELARVVDQSRLEACE